MEEVVQVALIAGSAGVLGGLAPAIVAGRITRKQSEQDAQRRHEQWLREERYAACSELIEKGSFLGMKSFGLGRRTQMDDGTPVDRSTEYLDLVEPLYRLVSRLGVLGPPGLERAAGAFGTAAVASSTAHLRGTREDQRAADQKLSEADGAFRLAAQKVLGSAV